MGNLIIKKVKYEGDLYSYESPELDTGINIVIGDNGSGKSTFTYFIEYCLGGYLKYFNSDNATEKYVEIIDDSNNYVELEVLLNSEKCTFKRFIDGNVIYVNYRAEYLSFPIYRQQLDNGQADEIFSDWLLDRLSIVKQELNLGTRSWKLNINDLLRLIIYDQDTTSKKIYKEPVNLNFITDSLIIRKTIFEVLLGITSDEYFRKFEEFKRSEAIKDKEQLKLEAFNERYAGVELDLQKIEDNLIKSNEELEDLYNQRDLFLSSNKEVDQKTVLISDVQEKIINDEVRLSELNLNIHSNQVEFDKISKYFQNQSVEINEIEKIIFTNEKLNLFSFKLCPFCMSDHEPVEDKCLCGAEIKDEQYEKFRYTSKEYENILKHKKKSLETIQLALDSYSHDINKAKLDRDKTLKKIEEQKEKLRALISSTDVNSNGEAIDHLHREILKLMKSIESDEYRRRISNDKKSLEKIYKSALDNFKRLRVEFESLQRSFEKNNKSIIEDFKLIYQSLVVRSSADVLKADINEDYMPVVDDGIYKNKSAGVPVRLIYYYTILALAIKYQTVKHPKLLIIDTPEDSGIDDDNLKKDLLLLKDSLVAVGASKESYQVILTTGLEKYPSEFQDFVFERFNKKDEGKYILKRKDHLT